MADIPYRAWFAFAARHFPAKTPKPLADLFCGPAMFSREAWAAGFHCVAVDRQPAFLKIGVCADAAELPFADAAFAGLAATNASLNYLEGPVALARHLAECSRVLAPGGAYVFDICPPERALALAAHTATALNGRVRFAHRYRSPWLTTTVSLEGAREEIHKQYIFSEKELADGAAAAGFGLAERTPNYGLPVTGENFPVMTWVLRKDAAARPR